MQAVCTTAVTTGLGPGPQKTTFSHYGIISKLLQTECPACHSTNIVTEMKNLQQQSSNNTSVLYNTMKTKHTRRHSENAYVRQVIFLQLL